MLPRLLSPPIIIFFFFNDTATTEIYTLSLHDALPIYAGTDAPHPNHLSSDVHQPELLHQRAAFVHQRRSEEHTSELQSLRHLVCRLLLEKKKTKTKLAYSHIKYRY